MILRSLMVYLISVLGCLVEGQCRTIALTQIVSHPALDAIQRGIRDELKEQGFLSPKDTVLFQEASGDMRIALQIAQKFAAAHPDVIIAITTPSAQAVLNAIKGTKIPLIFAAVTDPVGAGLVASLDRPSDQVTGTIDLPPMKKQIQLIQTLQPQARKIGVLYNTGEPNAVYQVNLFEKLLPKTFKIVKVGVSKGTEVPQAARKLVRQVDLIMLFNDNLIISVLESILKKTRVSRIPVFVSDPESVERGSLAAVANDQYQVGRETGKLAAAVLRGGSIADLPPIKTDISEVYMNEKTAKELGITSSLLEKAHLLKKS